MTAASGLSGTAPQETPLLTQGFLFKLTAVVGLLALSTLSISLGGRWLGNRIALAGHTESTQAHDIFIGQDHLRLPANVIRFENQRTTGVAERTDLYLLWPEMEGYSNQTRLRFNDVSHPESLIFIQLSQSTMSRDMSGRVAPIYSHLLSGKTSNGPAGLKRYTARESSGYTDEVFFMAEQAGTSPYAVRCIMPDRPELATGADCQRDIHSGNDLTVLYRFSSKLLPRWREMDAAVRGYVESKLVP
ncbi:hypothetical protein [Pararhizobium sp.]|uniref:hypothetical protein n=1 Tax=Pararhizobium sp. TaxID=1977563 RepID=UPI002728AED1|nr:hypothetical protein [Pararhizobium sp.]MDO9415336.1 hypothetical protein [Pararhizobium sp.]